MNPHLKPVLRPSNVYPLPTSETITEEFKRHLRHTLKKELIRWTFTPEGARENIYDSLTQTVIDLLMDFEPTKPRTQPEASPCQTDSSA